MASLIYYKISPINDGNGVHLTYIINQDIKMAGKKTQIAGKHVNIVNEMVDNIKKQVK